MGPTPTRILSCHRDPERDRAQQKQEWDGGQPRMSQAAVQVLGQRMHDGPAQAVQPSTTAPGASAEHLAFRRPLHRRSARAFSLQTRPFIMSSTPCISKTNAVWGAVKQSGEAKEGTGSSGSRRMPLAKWLFRNGN
jgi:hypothetical protein